MWRKARGNVLRQHFDDAMMRLKGANYPAMRDLTRIEELREAYREASDSERKALVTVIVETIRQNKELARK